MTIDDFVTRLSELAWHPAIRTWELHHDPLVDEHNLLRAVFHGGMVCCPITAFDSKVPHQRRLVAYNLGLNEPDWMSIQAAADKFWYGHVWYYDPALRRRLLAAVGLPTDR